MSAVKSIEKDELKDNSDMEFIVEKIHSKKCKDGKNVYLVEWANYPKKKDQYNHKKMEQAFLQGLKHVLSNLNSR